MVSPVSFRSFDRHAGQVRGEDHRTQHGRELDQVAVAEAAGRHGGSGGREVHFAVDNLGDTVVGARRIVDHLDAGRTLRGIAPGREDLPREGGAGALDLRLLRQGRPAQRRAPAASAPDARRKHRLCTRTLLVRSAAGETPGGEDFEIGSNARLAAKAGASSTMDKILVMIFQRPNRNRAYSRTDLKGRRYPVL